MPNLKRSRGKSVMDTDPTAVWVDPSAFKCVLYQDIEFEWKHISEPRFMSLDIIRSGIKCENFILKYINPKHIKQFYVLEHILKDTYSHKNKK
eukprot:437477_1